VKDSGAPSIGDLVVPSPPERHIPCAGLVTETKGIECKVLWSVEGVAAWWSRTNLKVVSPSGKTEKV